MTHTPTTTPQPVPLDKLTKSIRPTHYIGEYLDGSHGALHNAPSQLRAMADTLENLSHQPHKDKYSCEIEYCIGGALALLDTATRLHTLQQHGVVIDTGHPANIPVRALNDALEMLDDYVTETSNLLTESCLEGAQVAFNAYRYAFQVYDFLDAYVTATQ